MLCSGSWSDAALDMAMTTNTLHTSFGWHIHIGEDSNPRALRNFPMQGNGAEMMRIAACLATERGIEVCAPVHDAFLICAPLDRLEEDIATYAAGDGRGLARRAGIEYADGPDEFAQMMANQTNTPPLMR